MPQGQKLPARCIQGDRSWKVYLSRTYGYSTYLVAFLVFVVLGLASVSAFSAPSDAPVSEPLSTPLSRGNTGGILTGEDLLPPDQAFPPPLLEQKDPATLIVGWQITEGYYLYRDRFRFRLEETSGKPSDIALVPPRIPRGVMKAEDESGPVEVFSDAVEITLPVVRRALWDVPAEETKTLHLIVNYQGCAESGLCYPPFTKVLPVTLSLGMLPIREPATERPIPSHGKTVSDQGITAGSATEAKTALETPESDRLAYAILANSLWVVLPLFFGFGLLLGFTACVFPMIPILASIIAGQGATTRKAFSLSVVYVLAMAITYSIAGVIAGLFGHNLQAAFQHPWVIVTFSAIFVLLALSMFGLFRIQIPANWQTKLTMRSNLQQGGSFAGVAIMGFLSALIVGPCVAPPLAGALIAIGTTGDPVRGGLALFFLSLGMGAPLIAIGTSAGRWLPKAGPWMQVSNRIFGVLLLTVALYLLQRILPGWISMFLWGVFSIMIGVYLGAGEPSKQGDSGWRRFRKGAGIVAMVYGIMLMAGAGGEHPFRPLEGLTIGEPKNQAPVFERIKTVQALQDKLATVRVQNDALNGAGNGRGNRFTMLDYYADWCIACKEMETQTFSDPGVRGLLADMVLLQADVTENDQQDQEMLRAFGLYGPPAILFFGPDGKECSAYRIQGFMDAKTFREHLERLRNGFPV
uniref:Thiol:disulfide interchange protein DsbD n=1 Tax=Candidatus Kentrum sp. MB TaxID=2138164 RepID=A0A450XL79_9GAMM|nr:MAG: thiol:disulfide interchange protein DsbD [Candidatus Kentron sp. MB]